MRVLMWCLSHWVGSAHGTRFFAEKTMTKAASRDTGFAPRLRCAERVIDGDATSRPAESAMQNHDSRLQVSARAKKLFRDIRALWKQPLILNRPGRTRSQIGADVASGAADLESYGQMILANPDLIARLKSGAPLNEADRATFFAGSAKGVYRLSRARRDRSRVIEIA